MRNDRLSAHENAARQARFAHQITACLSEIAEQTPADVDARLRFAREQALDRARQRRLAPESAPTTAGRVLRGSGQSAVMSGGTGGGTGGKDGGGPRWWLRAASVLPLAVLIAGLMLIQHQHDRAQIQAAADVDTALLSDSLPPDAYTDAGFVEFLKSQPQE